MDGNKEEPKRINPLAPLTEEQLEGLKTALEQDPVLVEGAAKAPEHIQNALEGVNKEFIAGFLAGATSTISIISTANKAAQQNDLTTAQALNNRLNTLNYMMCKFLLEGQSRIITTTDKLH